jgi:hypothetical protein
MAGCAAIAARTKLDAVVSAENRDLRSSAEVILRAKTPSLAGFWTNSNVALILSHIAN